MAAENPDMLLGVVVLVLLIASVGTWFYLFDRMQHGPILKFQPRRPVPWHGVWALIPVALVVLVVGVAIYSSMSAPAADPEPTPNTVMQMAAGVGQQVAIVVAFLVVMVVASDATWSDLGLPRSIREFGVDVRIGTIAWLASLVPVFGTQLVLVLIFGHAEGHPLIHLVKEQGFAITFGLVFVSAVVVAPLMEEPLFRLVLQGSLEKWEDGELGWRTPKGGPIELVEIAPVRDAAAIAHVVEVSVIAEEFEPAEPPATGFGGLPHGWVPIGLSSLLFALAHVGWGPDPVALFLLALILGYVYQRTHRIMPSIVTHALFNGLTMFALWRFMSAAAP